MQSSTQFPVTPTWQNPYVEVIRYGFAHSNVGWQQHGDVEQVADRQIQKNVFKIRGAIAATNYVRFPREVSKGNQGLGLTGRYIYIQLRRAKGQPATLHLDLLTMKKSALRLSFSSMYTALRSSGTVLRVPLDLSEVWTTLVIDMTEMLQLHGNNGYSREGYRYLKAVTCCASMNLRNIFTSSTCYTPQNLPGNLALPAVHGNQFGPLVWTTFPGALGVRKPMYAQLQELKCMEAITEDQSLIFDEEDDDGREIYEDSAVVVPISPSASQTVLSSLQQAGESAVPVISNQMGSPPLSPTSRTAGLIRDREDVLARADQIMRDAGFSVPSPRGHTQGHPSEGIVSLSMRDPRPATASASGLLSPRRYLASEHSDWPDPILSLTRIIGFSTAFPRALRWIPDAPVCVYASYSTIVLREFIADGGGRRKHDMPRLLHARHQEQSSQAARTSSADDAGGPLTDDHEVFLTGHTGEVCALTVSRDGTLLASAQNTPQCVLRLWDLRDGSNECVIVMNAPTKRIYVLTFSKDTTAFCIVGCDDRARTQIYVWDVSSLLAPRTTVVGVKKLVLRARQTCDYPIHSIAFSPYETDQLVSCGKENIRFWRIHETRHYLPGTPLILKEYSRGTVFTDIAFDCVYPQFPSNLPRIRPVYISSSVGSMVVINYDTREIVCVYKLHDGAINSICVNEGFCVTGSDDKFLRVWPLDFSDFFLEAEHEEAVQCVDVSSDGMRVTAGTSNGAIGILHLADQRYRTVLRSHTQSVQALTALTNDSFVTSAVDGTLRVWDSSTGAQTMEFDVSKDLVTCLIAMPGEPVDGSTLTIAAGFRSGMTRIFSLGSSAEANGVSLVADRQVLFEFQQHQSSLCDVQYQIDGKTLYTSATGQQLCMYDVAKGYTPIKMLIADMDPDPGKICLSRDRRFVAMIQKGRRSILLLDTVSLSVFRVLTPPKSSQPATIDSLDSMQEISQVVISWNSQELLTLTKADRLYVFSLCENQSGSQATGQFGSVIHSMPLLGQQGITAFALSPNLKYMATGGSDSSVRIWQCDFGRHKSQRMNQTFRLHAGKSTVRGLAFSNDGSCLIATSDSSSACFVWRFRGNTSKLPTLELQRDLSSSQQIHKTEFELPIDDISNKNDIKSSEVNVRVEEKSPVPPEDGKLNVAPISVNITWKYVVPTETAFPLTSCYAWASAVGCIFSTVADGRVVVMENIESGQQYFLHVVDPVEHFVLSPSQAHLAILSSCHDNVIVCDLEELRRSHNQAEGDDEDNTNCFARSVTRLGLPQALERFIAVEFSVDGSLLCVCGETSRRSEIFIIDIPSGGELVWHVGWLSTSPVMSIISQSPREFLYATRDIRLPFQRVRVPPFALSSASLTLELAIDEALPAIPHVICFRDDGDSLSTEYSQRCRFGVVLDSDAYCYFMDFERQRKIHTMQLLLPSTQTSIANIAWIGTTEWQALIVTLMDDTIAVFVLPTQFAFTPSRTRVATIDWVQLKRTGRLTSAAVWSFKGHRIKKVLHDPLTEMGMVITRKGAVIVINFQTGQRRLLRGAPALQLILNGHTYPRLTMRGAVLLTLSSDRRALQCWELSIGREFARLQVNNISCSCFTTSPFDVHLATAGYDDGSLRVFDVNEQQLLAHCVLPSLPQRGRASSSGKSYGAGSPSEALSVLKEKQATKCSAVGSPAPTACFKELHFIGPRCILAVLNSYRVVLFDLSGARIGEADELTDRVTSGLTKGNRPGISTRKTKEKPIHYRELLPPSPDRTKWLTKAQREALHVGSSTSVKWDVEIHGIDVQILPRTRRPQRVRVDQDDDGGTASTQAFLVVTKWTNPKTTVEIIHIFAANDIPASHPVHTEDDATPCDSWLLQTSGQPLFHPTNSNQVVYPIMDNDAQLWIEIRDFRAHAAVLRLALPHNNDVPRSLGSLMRWHVQGKAAVMLTTTNHKPVAVVDLVKRTLLRVNVDDGVVALPMTLGSSLLLAIAGPSNDQLSIDGTASELVVADVSYSPH